MKAKFAFVVFLTCLCIVFSEYAKEELQYQQAASRSAALDATLKESQARLAATIASVDMPPAPPPLPEGVLTGDTSAEVVEYREIDVPFGRGRPVLVPGASVIHAR